ncbi:MAG: TM2 domain-containing protein [Armatimonadetes bacterium]|nr:TM2 domain-containing protein [Armatimonadota bacterium]
MISAGQLAWTDQVTRGGTEPWRPIVQVPEFSQAAGIYPTAPVPSPLYAPASVPYQRSYIVAALLAFFLGGLGIHKFYNGSWGWGIIYVVFCWTFIPGLVALIEGILYLVNPAGYDLNYNQRPPDPWKW